MKKKLILITVLLVMVCLFFTGCSEPTPNASQQDINITKENAQNLAKISIAHSWSKWNKPMPFLFL